MLGCDRGALDFRGANRKQSGWYTRETQEANGTSAILTVITWQVRCYAPYGGEGVMATPFTRQPCRVLSRVGHPRCDANATSCFHSHCVSFEGLLVKELGPMVRPFMPVAMPNLHARPWPSPWRLPTAHASS
mmetsp:Transcript_19533/g.59089  ORF Transcript_19533/g.59089 Transcript_19533/m.59089 type:complete len:132 (-) Transcript_19533:2272-2667(-)